MPLIPIEGLTLGTLIQGCQNDNPQNSTVKARVESLGIIRLVRNLIVKLVAIHVTQPPC